METWRVSSLTAETPTSSAVEAIAAAFVAARKAGRALPDFPGAIPQGLDSAYACQEAAIGLWDDAIAGWKVGRVGPEFVSRVRAVRLAGPIFSRAVWRTSGVEPVSVPVFKGGFAAVEAEFVFHLLEDAPPNKTAWTVREVEALPYTMHIGIEMAGSPLATINALGPTVVASDFGNNAGLVLGPAVPDWRDFALEALACETFVAGESVGRGSAASLPDGPLASAAFLLGHVAGRGRPLKAGQLISTGAMTGVHDIAEDQDGRATFGRCGELNVRTVRADPQK